MPRSAARFATLPNQCCSFGASSCVNTRGMSTPRSSSSRKQRKPTSLYAKTTALNTRSLALAVALRLEHRGDDVAWPAAHLLVGAADVLANQADAEEREPDQHERN